MLIVLAFRQVCFSKDTKFLKQFYRYLLFLKRTYSLALPGNLKHRCSVILTFDHASIDFYSHIFPFLQEHDIPAIVGIAWRYVANNSASSLPLDHRLAPSNALAFQDEIFASHQPFCSQEELKIIAESPNIQLASSGFAIRNLQHSPPYLATEIFLSKFSIKTALGKTPIGFFYPFGKYDFPSTRMVKKHYPFSFILGDTINKNNKRHNIYRIDIKFSNYTLPKLLLKPKYLKNWIIDRYQQMRIQKCL
ncbi:hypothetical protein BOKEGFJH_00829 [Chlamydia avium]|uniref:Polysaccharide deacetylase family protein n=1 Tax=Chlamydia avium 10DC88 TaxID=1229831 RepID=W8JN60_9CHLA|nr:polysaccharide deacetylase family protein [Chlamydia avium]AHK63704.1 Polysaccharide deacetylase family protein [Chlamydia avium 10DC88]VVT43286.1 hypothetical protein BOKEGFJH_00829 [Chlamydia avium]